MTQEFDLIRQLSEAQTVQRDQVVLGIGDDGAVLDVPHDKQLVISTDTLNVNIHFPEEASAEDIGYKSLAVNLSDIAAMGAEPVAVSLSLCLPEADETWIQGFVKGFYGLAERFNVQLIGGDTTQGTLSISITIYGLVSRGNAVTRSGACPGDAIYVTGALGDAGLALLALQGEVKLTGPQNSYLMERFNRPVPRVEIGQSLTNVASSMIDISDGLAADLGHILEQSGCGAIITVDQLPISAVLDECFDQAGGYHCPLYAGDDYELCFTVPESEEYQIEKIVQRYQLPVSCVGMVEDGHELYFQHPDGSMEVAESHGYQHF